MHLYWKKSGINRDFPNATTVVNASMIDVHMKKTLRFELAVTNMGLDAIAFSQAKPILILIIYSVWSRRV